MTSALLHSETESLLSFAAAYASMLVTPGPSFAVVSQASLSATPRAAALVVIGIASGASLLIMLVLSGAARLPFYESSEQLAHYGATALLLIIGSRAFSRLFRPATVMVASPRERRWGGHFALGLLTALTNPISFAFFTSVALATRSIDTTAITGLLPLGVFLMALGWFGLLATLLTLPAIKAFYLRSARHVDGVMGAVLITIAVSWVV